MACGAGTPPLRMAAGAPHPAEEVRAALPAAPPADAGRVCVGGARGAEFSAIDRLVSPGMALGTDNLTRREGEKECRQGLWDKLMPSRTAQANWFECEKSQQDNKNQPTDNDGNSCGGRLARCSDSMLITLGSRNHFRIWAVKFLSRRDCWFCVAEDPEANSI